MPSSLFPEFIPSRCLKLSDVPNESAPWSDIDRFMLTFDPSEDNPYKVDRRKLATLSAESGLVRLRAHLFMEQRAWNHVGRKPDASTVLAIRRVVALIRAILSEQNKEISETKA